MKTLLIISLLVCLVTLGALHPQLARAGEGVGRHVGKKGVCLNTMRKNADVWKTKVAALRPRWHYSWGASLPEAEVDGVEFVPMMWGYRKANERFLRRIEHLKAGKASGSCAHLLGFNEPDGETQANMSVELAIAAWPYLESTGLRLGSPAAVHADREWMRKFMKQAVAKKLRIDFVCVHWYGGTNVEGFVNRLKRIHEMYGRPIWITEFAVADWKAKTRKDNRYSPEKVLAFMKRVLPRLDELEFVERYAWFSSEVDHKALGPSALFRPDGSLTELGRFYGNHKGPTKRGDGRK